MSCRLSVIVPVYNVAQYLRECLSSVAKPGVEVIAVDDGSTDGSGAILDGWQGIEVIHQANAGAGAARNAGIEAAHGEWLMFVDADDLLADGWVEVVQDMIERYPEADMVGFGKTETLPLKACGIADVRKIDVREVVGREHFFDGMWQFAYRREMVGAVRFQHVFRIEDKLFQAEMLARTDYVMRSEAIAYGYRQHEASIMHQAWNERNFAVELRVRMLWLDCLGKAGKRMDAWSMRFTGLHYLEYFPYFIRTVKDRDLRERMTEMWFDSLRDAAGLPFAPYQRFVLRLLAVTRSKLLSECLCHFPFALKQFLGRGAK